MTKNVLTVIGMLLLGCAAKSQSRFGAKVGLNVAGQRTTNSIDIAELTSPFIGYQLGVFYKTKPNNNFLVCAEANFSVIGSTVVLVTGSGEQYDAHRKLGYLELPVMLQYQAGKFYFGAGPSVGFKLFSRITNFERGPFNIPYYKTFDAAVNILAGYSVSERVGVDLRYSHGIVNIEKDPGDNKTKNQYLNVSVLYFVK
jgi:hypothetical protein